MYYRGLLQELFLLPHWSIWATSAAAECRQKLGLWVLTPCHEACSEDELLALPCGVRTLHRDPSFWPHRARAPGTRIACMPCTGAAAPASRWSHNRCCLRGLRACPLLRVSWPCPWCAAALEPAQWKCCPENLGLLPSVQRTNNYTLKWDIDY